MRNRNNWVNDPATPHRAVKPDQTASAPVMIQTRLNRSASQARGMARVE